MKRFFAAVICFVLCLVLHAQATAQEAEAARTVACPPVGLMLDVPDTLLVLTRDLPADDQVYEALGIGSEAAQALLVQRDMVLDALPEDRSWEITLIAQASGSKDLDKMNRLEARVTTELALRQAQGWGFRVTSRTREQKGECLFEHLLGTLEGREKELYVTVKNGFLLVLSMNVYQGALNETHSAVLAAVAESMVWESQR